MPDFLINVKTKGAKDSANQFGLLSKSLRKYAAAIGVAVAAGSVLKKAIAMSAEIEDVRRGFDNLAKSSKFSSQAFNKLKVATDGTVDSMKLMQQANNAMLLGITDSEDEMAEMFDMAQRLGAALGRDTASAVESLVTGLGRQSKLMLDNLGIMVDVTTANQDYADTLGISVGNLTDQQKKQAFTNATIKAARDLTSQLGEEVIGASATFSQMQVAIGDLTRELGDFFMPIAKAVAIVVTSMVQGITKIFTFGDALAEIGKQGKLLSPVGLELFRLKTGLDELTQPEILARLEELGGGLGTSSEATSGFTLAMEKSNAQMMEESELMRLLIELHASASDGMDGWRIKYEEFALQKEIDFANYTREQEFIENLIKTNPQLAKSLDLVTDATKNRQKAEIDAANASAKAFSQFVGGAKIAARIQQAAATVDAYRTINKIMADPKLIFPTNVLMATAVGASAFANVMSISQQMGEFTKAATGMNEVVNKPTMILAGEAGAEQVSITPLEGPNIDGPQGGAVNITFSGNVMSQDFIENEAIPQIKEAIRRGADIGIS